MIISRTPLRIGFAGGGSDLPGYYRENEGAVLTTAFNKYIYVTLKQRIDKVYKLNYSAVEICKSIEEVKHPIFRKILKKYFPKGGIEISVMSDVPSGTGLGSSSALTVGVLHAIKKYLGEEAKPELLAIEACDVEINQLKEPIGKQDQFIASQGGFRFLLFKKNGDVETESVKMSDHTLNNLTSHSMLFYTGMRRDTKEVFSELKSNMAVKKEILREMVTHAHAMKEILESQGNIKEFAERIHDCWELKKRLASKISTPEINLWYEAAVKAGAWGGKILGAGRGGFIFFLCPPERQDEVKHALAGLEFHRVSFEPQGSQIIFSQDLAKQRSFENVVR